MDQSDDLSSIEGLGRLYRRRVEARDVTTAGCVTPDAMLALLQREGSESDRLVTLEHVMSCPACHREYEWLAAVDRAATETGGRPAGAAWWRRAPLALAASLAAALGAAFLVRAQLQRAGESVRGETGEIALLAPAAGTSPTGTVAFTWHSLPEASAYVLEIQGANRSVIRSDTTADTTLVLPSLLPAGEYRWWVREVTDGAEPRSSAFRTLKVPGPR
jgi:anti-sigma factor RsiW